MQRIIVAKLLLPSQYGLWSAVLLAVLTILFLKNAGVGDKFVQQQEADQERAFQTAFSIDLLLALGCVVIGIVALPLVAAVYGKWQIIAPGMVLSLAIVGNSLQAPIWIHYREMNFARQRLLLAIDPCVTFVVTVVLALLGAASGASSSARSPGHGPAASWRSQCPPISLRSGLSAAVSVSTSAFPGRWCSRVAAGC